MTVGTKFGSTYSTDVEHHSIEAWTRTKFLGVTFLMAKISVTSPIVINMPTRELLAGETKNSFV